MKPRQVEASRARARRNKMDLIVGYFKCEIRVLEKYLNFVAGKKSFPARNDRSRHRTAICTAKDRSLLLLLLVLPRERESFSYGGGNWEEGKLAFRKLKSRAFGK